jgi:Flp pilus assembly protein TadD
MALGFRAGLELDAGHANTAATQSAEALNGLSTREYFSARGEIWLIQIRALRAMGRSTQAKEETERFSAWARTRLEPDVAVHLNLAEAEQAQFERQDLVAFSHYDDALRAAHNEGVPAEIAEVVIAYGNALIEAGDLEHASAVVGEAGHWMATDYDCAVLQARLYHALGQTQAWRTARDQASELAGERRLPVDLQGSDQ